MIDKSSLDFDKHGFACILKSIQRDYKSQEEFAKNSNISRTYLSLYMNEKMDKPPNLNILQKLVDASFNTLSLDVLCDICGYQEIEDSLHKLKYGNVDFLFKENEDLDIDAKINKIKGYISFIENYKRELQYNLKTILNDSAMKLLFIDTTHSIKSEISLEEKRLKSLRLGLEKLENKRKKSYSEKDNEDYNTEELEDNNSESTSINGNSQKS